jgi:hypothetical protein
MSTVEVATQIVGDTELVLTQGDTALVEFQLFGADPVTGGVLPQSTDGAQRVEYRMTRIVDRLLVQDWTACTMDDVDTSRGHVVMTTTERGTLAGCWRVTFADGSTRTYPDAWTFTVRVRGA